MNASRALVNCGVLQRQPLPRLLRRGPARSHMAETSEDEGQAQLTDVVVNEASCTPPMLTSASRQISKNGRWPWQAGRQTSEPDAQSDPRHASLHRRM